MFKSFPSSAGFFQRRVCGWRGGANRAERVAGLVWVSFYFNPISIRPPSWVSFGCLTRPSWITRHFPCTDGGSRWSNKGVEVCVGKWGRQDKKKIEGESLFPRLTSRAQDNEADVKKERKKTHFHKNRDR